MNDRRFNERRPGRARGLVWAITALAFLIPVDASQAGSFHVLHGFPLPPEYPAGGIVRDSAGDFFGTTSSGGTYDLGVVYKLSPSGAMTILHSFTGGSDGAAPWAPPLVDASGNLFGTATAGGATGNGTIFEIDNSGIFTVLHSFQGLDGAHPQGALIMDPANNLYGTAAQGGAYGAGVAFEIDSSGAFTLLHNFTGGQDGANPSAGLLRDSSGNLYGTASGGGAAGMGTVFRIEPSKLLTPLYSFTGGADGGFPLTSVIEDSSSNLYGTTYVRGFAGGCAGLGCGTVFRLDPSGSLTTLYTFTGNTDGANPEGSLIRDSFGTLYGTTSMPGFAIGIGTVFKLDMAGTLTTLHAFSGGSDGANPTGSLAMDLGGNIYGTTAGYFPGNYPFVPDYPGTLYALAPDGTLTTLHDFGAGPEGYGLRAGVVQDSSGDLLGTTYAGGAYGRGTVFRLDTGSALTTLHDFAGTSDGATPQATLILDASGNLFGTASQGGANGYGTVFELDSTGALTTLHSFSGGSEGWNPLAALVRDPVGALYGTTQLGGVSGEGTIFKIDPTSVFTTIHDFTGNDGAYPETSLILDSGGNLYGTAPSGGDSNYGTAFKLDPAGNLTRLHSFTGGSDGGYPRSSLLLSQAGLLYGTTWGSGTAGTVFAMDSSGTLTTIHQFYGYGEGGDPMAPLIMDSTGNLMGTASSVGGPWGWGTVFKLDLSGTLTTLHYFNGDDGQFPTSALAMDSSGNFYGTTIRGIGTTAGGTIFSLQGSACQGIGVGPELLPSPVMDAPYSQPVTASGGAGPYAYAISSGSLPEGLSLDGAAGAITGMPTSPGSWTFSVLATDANHCVGSQDYCLVVNAGGCPAISVSPSGLPGGNEVMPYNLTLFAEGGSAPYGFTVVSGDPAGLSLDRGTGLLSGTLGYPGVYNFTVAAIDSAGCGAARAYTLVVSPIGCGGVVLSPPTIADGQVGAPYSQTLTGNDGQGPYTFSLASGALPPGLALDASTGNIGGTPAAEGVYQFTAVVTDASSCSAGRDYSITIASPGTVMISSVSPRCGSSSGGDVVTISGSFFQPGAAVKIAGQPASGVSYLSPSQLTAMTPANAPGTAGDIVVANPDGTTATLARGFAYDFADVPAASPFHDFICAIARNGLSGGCGGGDFCPAATILRAQMAVFLLRGAQGNAFVPPPCTGVFADTPCPGAFTDWIEETYREGITGGCAMNPLSFCPGSPVTRSSMAVLLFEAEHGPAYAPPACTGVFADVSCPGPFANFIEQLYREGITSGCSNNPLLYCPGDAVTRAQMAVLLTTAFRLP